MSVKNKLVSRIMVIVSGVILVLVVACSKGSVGAAMNDGGTKPVTINDPILNMQAYSLTVPANWMFQGLVRQGTPCVPGPFPVFRTFSPDGLTGTKMLPRLDWMWWDNPSNMPKNSNGCLEYKRELPAAEFLKYMINVLQVEYVKDEPIADLAERKSRAAAQNTSTATTTADAAAATVRYYINKIPIQERLIVNVSCTNLSWPVRHDHQHLCSGYVTRFWAPEGKLDMDLFKPLSKSFAINQEWITRWNQQMVNMIKAQAERNQKMLDTQMQNVNRQMKAQYSSFQQSQDLRQRQHDDFMASMQRGTDMSMQRTGENMNARGRMAGDWADYSLDQQKRLDPNTGLITKDSAAYSYTWVNEHGDRVQTNNVNANPNGNGTGNWTLQENVR